MKYSKLFNTIATPQSQPIPLSGQMPNAAGGFGWDVDRWARLDRFLILGSETGTYYIGEQKLTVENAKNVIEAIKEDGERVVARIVAISHEGRAPKNDPAIFALALAASYGDEKTRLAAFEALPKVCRTGTHLFAFTDACKGLRGWGRGMRKAIASWYNAQTPESLTYALVKYQSRNGWSHRDLLRLAHPKPVTEQHKVLYKWVVDGELTGESRLLEAMLKLRLPLSRRARGLGGEGVSVEEAASLILANRIPREAVPTELLTQAIVWEALLADMPLGAMIRNLGNMSKVGLLKQDKILWMDKKPTPAVEHVVASLKDKDRLRKARIHPIGVLSALVTYAGGKGLRGKGDWDAVPAIVDALDSAFYASFANVEPTGKRIVLGLDVSGSMAGTLVAGVAGLDCRKASGAMALVTSAVEDKVTHLAFDTVVYPLKIGSRRLHRTGAGANQPAATLESVVKLLERTGGGGTDCAAPIRYAIEKKIAADAFVIYTDSETWYGSQHPAQAIAEYRRKMGIDAKLVVVAMASNRTSIGDPGDAGTLNVVGFDTTVPQVIAEFLR